MAFGISAPIDFAKPIDKSFVKDKAAIVTGGSTGIGAAIVKSLASNGAFVLIADVNDRDGKELASRLTSQGQQAIFHHTDVTSFQSQLAAFKTCIEKAPNSSVDIVIACAGVPGFSILPYSHPDQLPPDSDPLEPPLTTISTNLTGCFYSCHLACHFFSKAKPSSPGAIDDKHLLFVASLAGYTQAPVNPDYAAAKHGVRGLWKCIRGSIDKFAPGMRTNLIAPTFIKTVMTEDLVDDLDAQGYNVGDVEDAAQGVLRLCCDRVIAGRAMCIAARLDSNAEFGTGNFDLEDDVMNGDASKRFLAETKKGTLGPAMRKNQRAFEESGFKPQKS